MKSFKKMEERVANFRKMNPRLAVMFSLVLALVGGGLIYTGFSTLNGREILAETIIPPVPPDPIMSTPTSTGSVTITATPIPPIPPDPNQPQLVFSPGWNMVDANRLQGSGFYTILSYGFFVYSFNDPSYPDRNWTVYSIDSLSQIGGESALKAINPLGYYIYNPTSQTYRVPVQDASAPSDKSIERGWHILYFSGNASTKDELLASILLKYSDGTSMTANVASSDANHRISSKIYVVIDEHAVGATSVKELTDTDSAQTISQIPAKSFLWFYARRTKDSISQISMSGGSSVITEAEKAKIDAWLLVNNLNQCGDSKDTVYTGGTCLFNEATGETMDKYVYLVEKFPKKPWNNLVTPTPAPSITSITACSTDKTYENSAVSPVTCACPPGYAFKVISTHWGACPKNGMTDCPASILQCVNK